MNTKTHIEKPIIKIIRQLAQHKAIWFSITKPKKLTLALPFKNLKITKFWSIEANHEFQGSWDGENSVFSMCRELLNFYKTTTYLTKEEQAILNDLIIALEELAKEQKKDLSWIRIERDAIDLSKKLTSRSYWTEKLMYDPEETMTLFHLSLTFALVCLVLITGAFWNVGTETEKKLNDCIKEKQSLTDLH